MADPSREPVVVTAMREFKANLLAGEQVQMQEMAKRWLTVERALDADINLLARELGEAREAGASISPARVYRLERYKHLQAQARREITGYVGWADDRITRAQGEMAIRGLSESAQAIQMSYWPSVGIQFDRLPIEAVQHMVGICADGKPVGNLLKRRMLTDEGIIGWRKLTNELVEGTARGRNPRQTAERMRDSLTGGLQKALVIARSEQLRVYRQVGLDQYNSSGVVLGQKRLTAHDGRVCVACIADDGTVYNLNQTIPDHPNGRCLVPGTLVSGPFIEALITRRYEGDVIDIRTASGKLLTVTPNHPILTDRGWIAAHLLEKGQNVVSDGRHEWATAGVSPDDYQMPTLVEEIASTLGMNRLGSVPCGAKDFHGDGKGSDVYVIWANSLLRDNLQLPFNQPICQYHLALGYTRQILLSALSDLAAMLKRLFATTRGFLSDLDAAMMLFQRNLVCEQSVGCGLASSLNIGGTKTLLDEWSRDTIGFGDSVLRFTRQIAMGHFAGRDIGLSKYGGDHLLAGDSATFLQRTEQPASLEFIREALFSSVESGTACLRALASHVTLDRVLEVNVRAFTGHVYNLQTKSHWYNANGIITHNCTAVPIVRGMPEITWSAGQDWFDQQDDATQRRIMGDERWDAYKDGRIQFAQMGSHTFDPTWGGGLRVVSLSDLLK